jgi:ParB family chromosome partitioning protein
VGRRSGLGKGLSALIPPAEAPAPATTDGTELRELPIAQVRPNAYQPRTEFDEDALEALTASVLELGVLQPVLVRPMGDHFELIAGERRWRAAQLAGLDTIPAVVRDVTDTTSLEQALVENLQRQDLTALEEAAAYAQLADEFGLSQDDIARRVGRSRSAVANTLRLLQLPPSVARLVNERALSAGHARTLLGLDDPAALEALAQRIVAEGLSVRATEQAVKDLQAAATEPEPAPPAPTEPRSASLLELEDLLSEHLDTRVHVQMAASGRGRIVVDFSGLEDLERVYRVLTEGREPQL